MEIDKKYPNRVIYDTGLVICRWGPPVQIGDGICVPGNGDAHYEVVFRLLVFRPFVDEVCVGKICQCSEEGVRVTTGFFNDVFIPAFWMLRPSRYDAKSGLWIWTPSFDDDEGDDEVAVKTEDGVETKEDENNEEEENRYEMYIGAEIKFKVKSLNFTKVTNTAKGVQATATTISHSAKSDAATSARLRSLSIGSDKGGEQTRTRRRSSSLDLTDADKVPASMQIVASICEDGLGLAEWWSNEEGEEEAEEEE